MRPHWSHDVEQDVNVDCDDIMSTCRYEVFYLLSILCSHKITDKEMSSLKKLSVLSTTAEPDPPTNRDFQCDVCKDHTCSVTYCSHCDKKLCSKHEEVGSGVQNLGLEISPHKWKY